MDEYSIAVITYVKNKYIYDECLFYIKNLEVPKNMNLEILAITEGNSVTEAYS